MRERHPFGFIFLTLLSAIFADSEILRVLKIGQQVDANQRNWCKIMIMLYLPRYFISIFGSHNHQLLEIEGEEPQT